MSPANRVAGFAVAAAATAVLVWASQVPVESPNAGDGLLRLAWRARPERIERCVTQSPEALAALPPHMRQTTICEGINASYRLEVYRGDEPLLTQTVEPGGLRRDRPLYVFHELPQPPDEMSLRITFTRIEQTGVGPGGDEVETPGEERDALREAVPESLVWEERVTFAPGQVRLISYDPARRVLFEVDPD